MCPRSVGSGPIEGDCLPDQFDEGALIQHVALVNIDGTSRAGIKARVEETGRVVQRGAVGEREFHLVLVSLEGADKPGAGKVGTPSGLDALRHLASSTMSGSAIRIRERGFSIVTVRHSSPTPRPYSATVHALRCRSRRSARVRHTAAKTDAPKRAFGGTRHPPLFPVAG